MKSKLSLLALALLSCTSSFAAVITVDDFEVSQSIVSNPTGVSSNSVTGGAYWTSRALSITRTGGVSSSLNDASVSMINAGNNSGQLVINNPTGVSSDTTLVWNFNAALQAIIASATNIVFTIDSTSQDVGSVTVASATGSAVRTTAGQTSILQVLVLGPGASSPYSLAFRTGSNVDTTFDNLRMQYSCATGTNLNEQTGVCTPPAQVPVPGSLALLGLGLIALARRKSA